MLSFPLETGMISRCEILNNGVITRYNSLKR